MRLEQFRLLNRIDQTIALWEEAALIGERENHTYKYILYQLDCFYIEVRLSKTRFKEMIRTFTRDRRLGPYLQNIDLGELGMIVHS